MPLPSSFSGTPQEDPRHHFRNVCIEMKRIVNSSKNVNDLEQQIDRFMNVCKQMNWSHKSAEVYHKDEAEKAINKVLNEYRKYTNSLKADPENAHSHSFLEAISEIEQLIRSSKVG